MISRVIEELGPLRRHKVLIHYSRLRRRVRSFFWSKMVGECGANLTVEKRVTLVNPHKISFGDNVYLNSDVWINGAGGVIIGADVLIGPRVIIHSANHLYDDLDLPIRSQGHERIQTHIEAGVWVGAAAIILPGVKIGRGAVIGAGAVVSKSIEAFSIAVGVPARVIASRLKSK